jgi:hypothetical protein
MPPGVPPTAPGIPGSWSPTDAYGFAWNAITKNFAGVSLPLAVAIFVTILPAAIFGGLLQFIVQLALQYVDSSFLGMLMALLYFVIGSFVIIAAAFISGGVCEFALKIARGQTADFGVIFGGGKYFGSMFVGWLVIGICNGLCIPGYIVMFGLWPFAFIIVDQNVGGMDALKSAWAMTTGHKVNIFLFWLLGLVVIFAGEIACFFPVLLLSYPMIILGTAHMYLSLKGESPRLA